MLSTGSVDGCRLIFSEVEGPPIRGTEALGKPGNGKYPLRARAEDFCFPGAGVKAERSAPCQGCRG